jgi:hypothetical protein
MVFARDGQLIAVKFDPDRLEVTGPEVPVLEGVSHSIHTLHDRRETGAAHFAISSTGVLAYVTGSVFPQINTTVVWVDRQGREEPLEVDPKMYISGRVSADAGNVLLCVFYPPRDVWLWDVERLVQRRQTFEGSHIHPIWGPELDEFTVVSDREGPQFLYRKGIDSGPGRVEKFSDEKDLIPSSWSPDGSELAFVAVGEESSTGIFILSLEGGTRPFVDTRFSELYPEFSPDGRWLVYTSSESGQQEVYVRPYPGPGRAVQISTHGGIEPAWSTDAQEIFYRSLDTKTFYSVRIGVDGDGLRPGEPEELFEEGAYGWAHPIRSYDVAPDGRFLVFKRQDPSSMAPFVDELSPTGIQVVQNWFAELEEKLPSGK